MGSTFGGLEIGKRGISVHQTALNVTAHNISNADNPHYARQRVTMESMDPLYEPSLNRANGPGQLGQGAVAAQIERIRDTFIDDQIISVENTSNYWKANDMYLRQMENIFAEPSDNSLRTLGDKFWAAWQELSQFPAEESHRHVVLRSGESLVTRVHDIHEKLSRLRTQANQEIRNDIDRVNGLAGEIRDLNERILKIQALGDNPNDLMDRRDHALEELSKLVNVTVGRGDKDELFVFIGEQALVQGEIQRKLTTEPDAQNEGMARITWEHNGKELILGGGHICGLLNVRDTLITERIDKVDEFALNVADIVNEIHRDGFGHNGTTNKDFFELRPLSANSRATYQMQDAMANYDLNGDGTAEVTSLFRVTGTNTIDPDKRMGISGTLTFFKNDSANTEVRIDYSEDDTLNQIIKRINDSEAGVVAYMNHDSQLALKATTASDDRRTNFMIRHLEDSGELLVGFTGVLNASGAAGAFDFRRIDEIGKLRAPLQDISLTPAFHPGGHLRVSEDVRHDVSSIAAGRGEDRGGTGDYNAPGGALDGSNALLIAAALKQDHKMIGDSENIEAFYNSLIAKLGSEGREAEDAVMRFSDDLVSLNNQRQSVMGVSLNEEMSNMVQFQHAFNASSRMINTMDQMLDVIIRMGA